MNETGGKMTFPIRTTAMLSDLIDLLREKGVLSLKWGDVELTLGPKPATPVSEPEEKRDTNVASDVDMSAKPRKIVKVGVKGKDGLTAEEQEEIYGQVLDAVPPEYEE